jgi:hypothetical protein
LECPAYAIKSLQLVAHQQLAVGAMAQLPTAHSTSADARQAAMRNPKRESETSVARKIKPSIAYRDDDAISIHSRAGRCTTGLIIVVRGGIVLPRQRVPHVSSEMPCPMNILI